MSHVTVITEVWTSTSDRRRWTRRGIRAEQRGDNSDRGMQRWNGLETPLLKVEIDMKLMTEWDKLNRRNRNNGAPFRTKLNTTVWPIHSPLNTSYTLTRVYVLLLVCDMFPQIVSSEGACYWGERQPDRRGSGRGLGGWEGGFGDAAGASPSSSLCLFTGSHHPSPDPQRSLSSQNSLSPPLCWCQRKKLQELLGSVRKFQRGRRCRSTPPMNGAEENSRARTGGKKRPGSVCCECISWAAALRCASVCAGFCRREGGLGPDWGAGS